jgi:PLP dependent protein
VDAPALATLAANVAEVRARVAAAAGRPDHAVALIAVTKYVDADVVAALLELGERDFGESRPQRIWELAPKFPAARWHLIGSWQTNKIRRTLPYLTACHSLDRLPLAAELSAELVRSGRTLDCFVEANVTGSERKQGFAPDELAAAMPQLAALPGLWLAGLMTMAEPAEDAEACRPAFRAARLLSERLRAANPALRAGLSMGMSGDYEAAIAEGATAVRVGSALFAGLPK